MSQMIEMRAAVASILWGPADDGYLMVSMRTEAGERIVAAGRTLPEGTQPGDEINLTGRWAEGRHGPYLAVQTAHRALPRTPEGLERWLTKAKIPGIGPIKAKRLVETFGMRVIDAICDEHEDARTIVGKKALPRAASDVRDRRDEAELGATLTSHGIGIKLQKTILKRYGDDTKHVIAVDPYRLILDIEGVAFTTADRIAQSAGIRPDDPGRIRAAIVDGLRNAGREGHCALYEARLLRDCCQVLYIDENLVAAQLEELQPQHIVRTEIRGIAAWATTRINRTEKELARRIARKLRENVRDIGSSIIGLAVDQAQERLDITLSEEQRSGAIMALSQPISILTGGPGTGKTHTLRVVVEAWQKIAPLITGSMSGFKLSAPTGKAAKRITETTGHEGTTIHRLLEYKPDENAFERNASNPLETGMICVDEFSMPDVMLTNDLARAWGTARVLLIGDIDQLPSVGPGKVLADMLESGKIPHTRLTQIFRQAAGSDIAVGADSIRRGEVPAVSDPGRGDLVHIEISDPAQAAERIVQMYVDRMPAYAAKHGLDPGSIQVLSPGHKNEVGTVELNRAIQRRLRGDNPTTPQVTLSEKITAGAGDKVIQLENDYERGIYNGDTGRIVEVEKDQEGAGRITHVDFGGTMQTFEGATLSNLGLAYALSIHKSQGSEYQIVIMPVTTSHWMLLRRPLLYTGTTRAKRLCVYVGTMRAIRTAVQKEDATARITTLAEAIVREVEAAE